MQFSKVTLAVLGLAASASAHMKISSPVPFGASDLNNSPLDASGSDFPCKQRANVYSTSGIKSTDNVMPLGSSQNLAFIGSAVHGGGSCQISITYDLEPTKNSVWKVIHSIEGGCPAKNQAGNLPDNANGAAPDTYSYTIPTTLTTGKAVLAWTWFNKVGNREMYMNCAPITITGGSSKRTDEEDLLVRNITQLVERDQNAYNALPDMFVANIGNGCGTADSKDVLFPNPGQSVEQDNGATSAFAAPTGSCQAAGAAPSSVANGGSGSTPTTAASSPKASTAKASATGLPGGVFATIAVSPIAAPTTVVASSPAPAVATSAAAPTAAASSAPAASAAPATSGTGSAIKAGTACTTEGLWNCIGGTSFQRCASGTWSVVQAMAAGTDCSAGQTMSFAVEKIAAKRSVRFSHEHIRRHAHHVS